MTSLSAPTPPAAIELDPKLQNLNFLIIGAQKGGTTWLQSALSAHHDVFIPEDKELHFFCDDNRYAKGPAFYASHFAKAGRQKAVGEATPNYFWTAVTPEECAHAYPGLTETPARVKAWMPHAKLLLTLRNPVARAVSAYHHFVLRGHMSPFKRLRDTAEAFGILNMGFYDRHLSAWREHFPADQFHTMIYEDDIAPDERKLGTLNDVLTFLEIDPMEDFPQLYETRNARHDNALAYLRQIPGLRSGHLDWKKKKMPFGERLAQAINRRTPQSVQRALKIKVEQADLDALQYMYAPHNRVLADMLERKLPW